jgi:hypothetical protein
MKSCGPRWLLLASLLCVASPARGAGIALAPPTPGPGAGITFTVALDAPTAINGYDVTIFWDALELSFLAATELSGLGFDTAPAGATPTGERVATIELTAVTVTDLFSVSFDVLPGALGDGADDFGVFVGPANGSGLIPGAIDNPGGAGFDVVPEPHTGALLALGLIAIALRRSRRADG